MNRGLNAPASCAGPRAAVKGAAPVRVGYTARHRLADGDSGMNIDLTDREWAVLSQ